MAYPLNPSCRFEQVVKNFLGVPEPTHTRADIVYRAAPYGHIATIPAGTKVIPATNQPREDGPQYFARPWKGMSEDAKAWERNYGFLLSRDEVLGIG